MRRWLMAFSSVVLTCSWLISSANDCGRYFLAMTWYMGREDCRNGAYARPRVIRGTRVKPLPLLPSGPGGVCSRPLHEARSLTTSYATSFRKAPIDLGGRTAASVGIRMCQETLVLFRVLGVLKPKSHS